MSIEEKILALVEEKCQEPEFSDCFVVELVLSGKKLEVFLDSDSAITFEKCQRISRHLEEWLDESGVLGESYTLEVSSAGVGKPLLMPRQFAKNKGRDMDIKLKDGNRLSGLLSESNETGIIVSEIIKVKEGKKNVRKELAHAIPYESIEKAIVKIRF